MRLDRFITLNIVQPYRQAIMGTRSQSVPAYTVLPILMYHSVSQKPEEHVHPYYQTVTHPKIFADQMALLKQEGYKAVSVEEGLEFLQGPCVNGEACVHRCVAITFDDGFRDFHTEAFAVLQEHGFTATVFVPTAFIGEDRRRFKGRECLTWEETREVQEKGIRFGSHTVSHPQLTNLSWKDIEHELRASKSDLEQRLGTAVTSFAYPFAFPQNNRRFCQSFRVLLSEAGYTCCATTLIGRAKSGDDPFVLKRLPVSSLDDPAFFLAKLAGNYDWLAGGQAAVKSLKGLKSARRVSAN